MKLRPIAVCRISTSPLPGAASSTVSSFRTSGPPCAAIRVALAFVPIREFLCANPGLLRCHLDVGALRHGQPHAVWHGQRRVRTVEELDRGEQKVRRPDVLDRMHHGLACAEGEVPGLALVVLDIDDAAVLEIAPRLARVMRRPEIGQDMAVESAALARRNQQMPDTYALGLRDQHAANATAVTPL